MRAHVATVRNPFGGASGRELRIVESPLPIHTLAPNIERPFMCLRNGEALLREHWHEPLADGDTVAFVALPQGGGGNGGSDPVVAVLTIAVMIVAPYAGVWGESMALGYGVSGTIGYGLAYGAVMYAGMSLINTLVPPPTLPSTNSLQAQAAPSPTYNLQAQGNMARLDAAIPVQYGRMRVYPDFASMPYLDYQGNEQYLYQLLCIGQGEFEIESIKIDDTSITTFDEVTTEIVAPYGTLTIFPSNVITSVEVSGQTTPGLETGTYNQAGTTTITVTQTAHGRAAGELIYLDFTSGIAVDGPFSIDTVPSADTFTVTTTTTDTTSGNVSVMSYVGGFIASAAGTMANTIGIDVVCPRGLYNMDVSTGSISEMSIFFYVEMRRVDDSGNPLEAWVVVGPITITAATTTPQRRSYSYPVYPGRYEVRLRRSNTEQTASNYGHNLVWAGLRAYLQEDRTFGNVTLLAVKMKASNSLSQQASRKINVTCTRKVKDWDPVNGWNTPATATRSIAWALGDAIMASYGGGLAESRLDGAELYALDAIWSARGDTFDGRFDNTITLWEALTKIAQAGRAKPYMQSGVIHVARDGAATVPVALFSQRNIVKGSFSIDYLMPTEDTSDSVDVGYFDETVWAQRRVVAALPGSTAGKPAKIDLFGVVSRDQAYREGLYHSACNRYRRKIIKFTTEMEGFIPSFGDLIAVQHDMPAWGQGGEIVAWDAVTFIATVCEPLTWQAGQTHYIGLRAADGSVDGPYAVTQGVDAYQVVFSVRYLPTITPYTGQQQERTHFAFGLANTWQQSAKVTAIRPKSHTQVEIEAVAEDSNVHTADQGVITPAAPTSQLVTKYTAPPVTGLIARSMPGAPDKMLLIWEPAPGADHYLIEQSNDGTTWTRTGETSANNYTATALYGAATIVRIAAVGLTRGQWTQIGYGLVADYMWNANDTTLMWTTDTANMWRY